MASFAFRAVCLLLVALALCQGAVAAPDMTRAQQISGVLVDITAMSDAVRMEAEKINDPVSGRLIFSTTVARGIVQIAIKVNAAANMLASMPMVTLGPADAKMVVVALTAFVPVHQTLLGVVIDKRGLLARLPIPRPVHQALLALEAALEAFAFAVIGAVPTEEEAADAQFAALRVTVTKAQAAYVQFAAPKVTVTKFLGGILSGILGGGSGPPPPAPPACPTLPVP